MSTVCPTASDAPVSGAVTAVVYPVSGVGVAVGGGLAGLVGVAVGVLVDPAGGGVLVGCVLSAHL